MHVIQIGVFECLELHVFNKRLSYVIVVIKLRKTIKLVLKSPDMYLALYTPLHQTCLRNTDNKLKIISVFSLQILCSGNLDEGYIFPSILPKLRSFLQ